MPSIRSIAALSAAFVAIALLVTAPAAAQTGSLWHDQKLSDMQKHDRDKAVDSRADQHYQMGLQHMTEIQRLLGDDDLGKRAERRLGRSYERAVKNFESAIEAEPEWIEPYVMLGSVHYKMKDYEAAQEAYEAALALEPENEDVQAYLATVNWYIEHPQAEGG
jgi:cytochrome c-type biogenesis protein CcmH/NrfG